MNPRVLFIVSSDPRVSHRPAEAIRIAAGVGVWKQLQVEIYLHGPAALVLGSDRSDLVDEENFDRYLPVISEFSSPIYVQAGPSLAKEVDKTLKSEAISDAQLAMRASQSRYVLRF